MFFRGVWSGQTKEVVGEVFNGNSKALECLSRREDVWREDEYQEVHFSKLAEPPSTFWLNESFECHLLLFPLSDLLLLLFLLLWEVIKAVLEEGMAKWLKGTKRLRFCERWGRNDPTVDNGLLSPDSFFRGNFSKRKVCDLDSTSSSSSVSSSTSSTMGIRSGILLTWTRSRVEKISAHCQESDPIWDGQWTCSTVNTHVRLKLNLIPPTC